MVILIKGLKHERHELLLIKTFYETNLFNHVTNQTFGQKGRRSIKMTTWLGQIDQFNGHCDLQIVKLTILI
jgi:hypothetical protein